MTDTPEVKSKHELSTLMREASKNGDFKAMEQLFNEGATQEMALDHDYVPAIVKAAWQENSHAVRMLLSNNMNANAQSSISWSAMSAASRRGNLEIMEILFDAGGNINSVTKSGRTPLHEAVAEDRAQAVSWLIKKGANLGKINSDGFTAKVFAQRHNILNCMAVFHSYEAMQAIDRVFAQARKTGI